VSSAGPFTATFVVASNLSRWFWRRRHRRFAGSPDRVSALSRRTTRVRIRPVLRDDRLEEAAIVSRFPSRFRCRHSLLGHPMPAEDSALLTVGLPATPEGAPDPDGVTAFRTNELRPGWVPSIPQGRRCSSRRRDVPDRRLPLFRGQSLDPAPALHQQGSASRGINEGSSNSPVRSSPRPRPPGWNEPPLRLPPEASAPRRPGADDARRGWGQAVEHGPGTTRSTSHPLILQSAVHSCDLASHRPWRGSARARRRRPLLREAAARRSDQPDRLHGSVAWIGAVSATRLLFTDAGA
jgi:hypothetical protein